mmetsp:Transcript_10403/g.15888  ORF Transcript_10403/g.15888 Transcript_10403/m.15888 type:complete len:418 (+) Transcript_10403:133-1386(+)
MDQENCRTIPTDANPYHEMNEPSDPGKIFNAHGQNQLKSKNETSQIGDNSAEGGNNEEQIKSYACRKKLLELYETYEFLLLITLAIAAAKIYPPLGAIYVVPDITADWIGVMFIFLLAGLALKTEEFEAAFNQYFFNLFVQSFNFGVVSLAAFALAIFLAKVGALHQSLADGMVICSCLPMAINMVIILCKNADGDEAAAVFNSAVGNLIGIFLSPVLILGYLGVSGDVNLIEVFWKLCVRVVVPLVIGQVIQKNWKDVKPFMKSNSLYIKKAQIYTLVFIVYTVFCTTFMAGNPVGVGNVLLMIFFQFLLLLFVTVMAWYSLKFLFPNSPRLRVMGLFGCTHKTVSVGVPLINAMYDEDPNVGLYTLPLLVWHPLQLVFGSLLVPRLYDFVQSETQRLDIQDAEIERVGTQVSWFY